MGKKDTNKPYICEFCGKVFARERTLISHSCIKKTRWLQKDQPLNVIAFDCWKRFYQMSGLNQGSKKRTYRDFIDSKYFSDFVKFSRFIKDNNIKFYQNYLDFLIKHEFKLKEWFLNSSYSQYLKQRTSSEDPNTAIERTIIFLDKWSQKNEKSCCDYYTTASPSRVVNDILNGHISPWLIYISPRAYVMIERMDDHQLSLIGDIINPVVWRSKMKRFKEETQQLEKILGEADL